MAPQVPPSVLVPEAPDADGHMRGVPVPRPIMPPLMCVLPQTDGCPVLVPMLPAMFMATCGRNTPQFMGTVPIQQGQVDTLAGMPPLPGLSQPPEPLHLPLGRSMGAGRPMFPGFVPPGPMHFGGAPPDGLAQPPMGMPYGPLGGPRAGRLLSGRQGSGAPSTLPPLLAEPEEAARRAGAPAHDAAASHRSRRMSDESMDKDDRPWTPKGRGTRSSRSGTRLAARRRGPSAGDGDAAAPPRARPCSHAQGAWRRDGGGHTGGDPHDPHPHQPHSGDIIGAEPADADVDELLGALRDDDMEGLGDELLGCGLGPDADDGDAAMSGGHGGGGSRRVSGA